MFGAVLLFLSAFLCHADGLAFENVTIRASNLYSKATEITNISTNNLAGYLPTKYFYKIGIEKQHIPILPEGSLANINIFHTFFIEDCGVEVIEPGALKNAKCFTLSLKGNKLKTINTGVFNEVEITDLDLSQNEISAIDSEAFDRMPRLHIITLDDNYIARWDNNWFKNTPDLNIISLTRNVINKLPSKAFKNLEGLDEVSLYFSHNKIEQIDTDAFAGLRNVKYLNLDNNLLKAFDEKLLQDIGVDILSINNNNITSLYGDMSNFSKVNHTNIDYNPIECKCLEKIKVWNKANHKSVDMFVADLHCRYA